MSISHLQGIVLEKLLIISKVVLFVGYILFALFSLDLQVMIGIKQALLLLIAEYCESSGQT